MMAICILSVLFAFACGVVYLRGMRVPAPPAAPAPGLAVAQPPLVIAPELVREMVERIADLCAALEKTDEIQADRFRSLETMLAEQRAASYRLAAMSRDGRDAVDVSLLLVRELRELVDLERGIEAPRDLKRAELRAALGHLEQNERGAVGQRLIALEHSLGIGDDETTMPSSGQQPRPRADNSRPTVPARPAPRRSVTVLPPPPRPDGAA